MRTAAFRSPKPKLYHVQSIAYRMLDSDRLELSRGGFRIEDKWSERKKSDRIAACRERGPRDDRERAAERGDRIPIREDVRVPAGSERSRRLLGLDRIQDSGRNREGGVPAK